MYCCECNRIDNELKTWVNFKEHFSRAFREKWYQSRQMQHIGYGNSNTQNSAKAAMLAEMTQDHSHVLENLATATQSDRTTVANMSKMISDLTLQLGQTNAFLTEAQSSIATLTSKLTQTGNRPNLPTKNPTGPVDLTLTEKEGYCWRHGLKLKKGHNSSTCTFQKQGHMIEATRINTMGGKMWSKGWDK